jgi:DNA-binding transcriptional MerR regulator
MNGKSGLSIGDLAKGTGTKVVTVRYYEQSGLLPVPSRTAGNYRTYRSEHMSRLRFIRRCRDLGFTLDQIRDLLRLSSRKDAECVEVDRITAQHLAEIEKKIADLKRLAKELRRFKHLLSGQRNYRGLPDHRGVVAVLRSKLLKRLAKGKFCIISGSRVNKGLGVLQMSLQNREHEIRLCPRLGACRDEKRASFS